MLERAIRVRAIAVLEDQDPSERAELIDNRKVEALINDWLSRASLRVVFYWADHSRGMRFSGVLFGALALALASHVAEEAHA